MQNQDSSTIVISFVPFLHLFCLCFPKCSVIGNIFHQQHKSKSNLLQMLSVPIYRALPSDRGFMHFGASGMLEPTGSGSGVHCTQLFLSLHSVMPCGQAEISSDGNCHAMGGRSYNQVTSPTHSPDTTAWGWLAGRNLTQKYEKRNLL